MFHDENPFYAEKAAAQISVAAVVQKKSCDAMIRMAGVISLRKAVER